MCSVPEIGAVLPATPRAIPDRVISRASSASAAGSWAWTASAASSSPAPSRRNSDTGAGCQSSSMPTAPARYQSAGAVNIDASSPNPARFMSGGASAMTPRSIDQAVRPARRRGPLDAIPDQNGHVVGERVHRDGGLHDNQRNVPRPVGRILADVAHRPGPDRDDDAGPGDRRVALGEGGVVGVELRAAGADDRDRTSPSGRQRGDDERFRSAAPRRIGVGSPSTIGPGAGQAADDPRQGVEGVGRRSRSRACRSGAAARPGRRRQAGGGSRRGRSGRGGRPASMVMGRVSRGRTAARRRRRARDRWR